MKKDVRTSYNLDDDRIGRSRGTDTRHRRSRVDNTAWKLVGPLEYGDKLFDKGEKELSGRRLVVGGLNEGPECIAARSTGSARRVQLSSYQLEKDVDGRFRGTRLTLQRVTQQGK